MPRKRIKKPGVDLPRELRLPIQVQSVGLWPGSLTQAEILRQFSAQAEEKLIALLNHYNIPLHSPHKWKQLSCCLAQEMGLMEVTFKRRKRLHPSSVWLMGEHLLVERMNEIIAKRRLSAMAAAKTLIARHAEYKHLTSKSLVNRYGEAKKRMQRGGLRPLWAS